MLIDPHHLTQAVADAEALLDCSPEQASTSWTLYGVDPVEVEFWQGQSSRRHTRLLYRRSGDGWDKARLWP